MKVYLIEEDTSTGMGGPSSKWCNGKIYSSIDKALKFFKKHSNEEMIIKDCPDTGYFSKKIGFLKEITIQDKEEWYRRWVYYIKEVEVK